MVEVRAPFEAVIHPYRSLGAFGFRLLIAVLVVVNLAFAGVMISQGAWPVVGFMGLDVLAIYVAFRLSYAQMLAFERVTIDGETLTVERADRHGRKRAWTFPSYWVSVWFEGDDEEGTVTLRSHGRSLQVGSYLAPFERKGFADALRAALRDAKVSAVGA